MVPILDISLFSTDSFVKIICNKNQHKSYKLSYLAR